MLLFIYFGRMKDKAYKKACDYDLNNRWR